MVGPRWDPSGGQHAPAADTPGASQTRRHTPRSCVPSPRHRTRLSHSSSVSITAGLPRCTGRAVRHTGTRWQKKSHIGTQSGAVPYIHCKEHAQNTSGKVAQRTTNTTNFSTNKALLLHPNMVCTSPPEHNTYALRKGLETGVRGSKCPQF